MESSVAQARILHFFPTFAITSMRRIPEGWDSFAFEVNGDHIVRFAKWPEVRQQYAQEAAILPHIAALDTIRIPRFDLVGRTNPAETPEFVGYPKLSGQALTATLLTPERSAILASQLGAWLARLHALPLTLAEEAGFAPITGPGWRARYEALYAELQSRAWPLLDRATQQQADGLWQTFLDRTAHFAFRPTLLHNDLNEDHVLCDLALPRVNAVIDWGDAQIGDPALEFAAVLYDFGAAFTEQAVAAYGSGDPTFWTRITFYTAILRCHEILFGLRNEVPERITTGVAHFGADMARFWPFEDAS